MYKQPTKGYIFFVLGEEIQPLELEEPLKEYDILEVNG